ncbi:hypothetical protein EAG_14811 [Camponotus floridanus]|uniref:Uncharacterized protein n=1 Tax=Camponotus floridanus TaxID=104421 RepID=E2AGM9_CAMFO|nr:hypothetical protein EAG_14811 [Camponotus floridanus]
MASGYGYRLFADLEVRLVATNRCQLSPGTAEYFLIILIIVLTKLDSLHLSSYELCDYANGGTKLTYFDDEIFAYSGFKRFQHEKERHRSEENSDDVLVAIRRDRRHAVYIISCKSSSPAYTYRYPSASYAAPASSYVAAGHTCAAVRVTGSRVTVAAAQVSWIARLVRDEGDGGSGGSSCRLLHARATKKFPLRLEEKFTFSNPSPKARSTKCYINVISHALRTGAKVTVVRPINRPWSKEGHARNCSHSRKMPTRFSIQRDVNVPTTTAASNERKKRSDPNAMLDVEKKKKEEEEEEPDDSDQPVDLSTGIYPLYHGIKGA